MKFLQKLGKSINASSSSAANLWYSHGHRCIYVGDDAGGEVEGV